MNTITIHHEIKGDADTIWEALVDGEITPANYVGFAAEFDLTPGAACRYIAGGGDMITGTVLEVEARPQGRDDVPRAVGPGSRRTPGVDGDVRARRHRVAEHLTSRLLDQAIPSSRRSAPSSNPDHGDVVDE